MTLCMAKTDGVRTIFGCDRRMSGDDWVISDHCVKWVRYGGWVILFSGVVRLLDVVHAEIRKEWTGRTYQGEPAATEYEMVEQLQKIWMDVGVSPLQDNRRVPEFPVEALLVRPGEIYGFRSQLSLVSVWSGEWTDIGAGEELALGTLETCEKLRPRWPDVKKMQLAYENASKRIPSIGGGLIGWSVERQNGQMVLRPLEKK